MSIASFGEEWGGALRTYTGKIPIRTLPVAAAGLGQDLSH